MDQMRDEKFLPDSSEFAGLREREQTLVTRHDWRVRINVHPPFGRDPVHQKGNLAE